MPTPCAVAVSSRWGGASSASGASAAKGGGEGWIRTSVRLRGQIYSLLPLTTRPPLHRCRQARHVAVDDWSVNATDALSGRGFVTSLVRSPQNFDMPPACRFWSG